MGQRMKNYDWYFLILQKLNFVDFQKNCLKIIAEDMLRIFSELNANKLV